MAIAKAVTYSPEPRWATAIAALAIACAAVALLVYLLFTRARKLCIQDGLQRLTG
jgi:hypothetical protein